jgi:hypothetical protein
MLGLLIVGYTKLITSYLFNLVTSWTDLPKYIKNGSEQFYSSDGLIKVKCSKQEGAINTQESGLPWPIYDSLHMIEWANNHVTKVTLRDMTRLQDEDAANDCH